MLPSRLGESPQLSTPDEFNPSWLTTTEILQSLEHHGVRLEDCQPSFRAAVAAMQALDAIAGADPRLVFYFDR